MDLHFTEPAESNPAPYHAATAEARLSKPAPHDAAQDIPEDEFPPALKPSFPTHALPEPLQSMVRHAALQTGTPESLCAAAGLGVISAAIGASHRVLSGAGRQTPANLFILAFAHSGTGKGQSFSVMAAPWHAEEKRRMAEWMEHDAPQLRAELETASADLERERRNRRNATGPDAAAAAASIQEIMKRKAAAEAALEREPLLNIGNATAEAIAKALASSPGEAGAILSAEARDAVANLLGRYSKDGKGSDESIFLQAYSGDAVTHRRMGRPAIVLNAPCLALCLAVQPDIWERMAGDARLMDSGFLARALSFNTHARPVRPSSYRIPLEAVDAWAMLVHDLLECREAPPMLSIPTPAALEVLNALAHGTADRTEEGGEWVWCRSFAARLAENAWRLAVGFHAVRHRGDAANQPLTERTARDAVTVAEWFFQETLALLSPLRSQRESRRMDALSEIFRTRQTDSLPLWKLEQNHGFKEEEIQALAECFPQRLRVATVQTGGRPSKVAQLISRAAPSPHPENPEKP